MGSPVIAGIVAHVVFWVLVAIGAISRELTPRSVAAFLILWVAGVLGLPRLEYGALTTPFVAALDVALVFLVLKGDVRLT